MTSPQPEDAADPTRTVVVHEGTILRKKNLPNQKLQLAVKNDNEARSRPHILARPVPYDFLYPGSVVCITSSTHSNAGDGSVVIVVDHVQLVKSAPDPTAVRSVIRGVFEGRHDPTVVCSTRDELEGEGSDQPPSREFVNVLIRRIRGESTGDGSDGQKGPPRKRPPHTSRRDVALLERLEEVGRRRQGDNIGDDNDGWTLLRPVMEDEKVEDPSMANLDFDQAPGAGEISHTSLSLPLNLPSCTESDSDDHQRRINYLRTKKEPQIRYLIAQMRDGGYVTPSTRSIIDVGGGRGDLAVAVAVALAFPHVDAVTIVDVNERSLRAAAEYAEKAGVASLVRTVLQDFRTYEPTNEVELVCGLHACGDLTDLAIDFARRMQCGFVLCPCCYTKRYIDDFVPPWCGLCSDQDDNEAGGKDNSKVIARLAETDFNPDVSSRARYLVNSMRLGCISSDEDYRTSLGMYSSETSKRNLVLMGRWIQNE